MSQPDGKADFYTQYVSRPVTMQEDRLWKVLREIPATAKSLLDVGCAQGRNLAFINQHRPGLRLVGTDVAATTAEDLKARGFEGVTADAGSELPFASESFDVVLCGEIIEHVVDPDRMVVEMLRVLSDDGVLLLTTPNLAYVPNRLLLLLGIQPLFTETSLQRNLGRKFKALGQGGATQGHLKIFTLGALLELLDQSGFEIARVAGYRFFQSGPLSMIDSIFSWKPSFAAGFVVAAKKKAREVPR